MSSDERLLMFMSLSNLDAFWGSETKTVFYKLSILERTRRVAMEGKLFL